MSNTVATTRIPTEQIYCENCLAYCKLSVSDGEYFCSKCGLVAENYTEITLGKPDSNSSANYSDLTRKEQYSFSNSSDHAGKDFAGKRVSKSTLAQLTYHEKTLEANCASLKERAASKGLLQVLKHCKNLALSKQVTEKVCETYRYLSGKGHLKGRHILGSILALVIIVANSLNCPISVAEILKDNNVLRRRFNKEYYHLYSLFQEVPKVAAAESYFQKYVSYISPFENYQLAKNEAIKTLENINYNTMQERIAMVTVGTILYQALKKYRYPALEKFLRKILINRLTIKTTWDRLLTAHPQLKITFATR